MCILEEMSWVSRDTIKYFLEFIVCPSFYKYRDLSECKNIMILGENAQKVIENFVNNDIVHSIHLKKSVINRNMSKKISIKAFCCVL